MLTCVNALIFTPGIVQVPFKAPYSAANDAWFVTLPVHDSGVVIPQLAPPGNTSCTAHSTTVADCDGLVTLLGRPWHNELMGDACDIRTPDARDAKQHEAACLDGGFVCATFPSGLRIQNNASALQQYSGSHRLLVRLVHIKHTAGVYLAHIHCLLLDVRQPQPATGAVALTNTCVQRGLQAPRYASMRETGGRCVWYCTIDRLRQPWNSDPPPSSEMSVYNDSAHTHVDSKRVCVLVPEDFVAVEFFATLELVQSNVDPRLLQPALLHWLDAVSRLSEQYMQARSGLVGFHTVLSVPGSAYHTHDLHAVVPDIVRARQTEYESIVLDSAWRAGRVGPVTAASRRSTGTVDLSVQGLHVMPPSTLGDAAAVLFSEQALVAALTQVEKLPGVQEAWLQTSTRLHLQRRSAVGPPTEVFFSTNDASMFALILAVTMAGVYVYVQTEYKHGTKHDNL